MANSNQLLYVRYVRESQLHLIHISCLLCLFLWSNMFNLNASGSHIILTMNIKIIHLNLGLKTQITLLTSEKRLKKSMNLIKIVL